MVAEALAQEQRQVLGQRVGTVAVVRATSTPMTMPSSSAIVADLAAGR